MIVIATVARADTRIGFTSDRTGNGDVYRTRDDGSAVTKITDESGTARDPSIGPGGKWVVYDVNGALYMNDFADPIGTPISLSLGGYNVNAGPFINSHRDFRILYTVGVSGHTEIYMAVIDGSSHAVIGTPVSLTTEYDNDKKDPAFCGSNHFVYTFVDDWSHICYRQFNGSGAVGDPTCWFDGDLLLDEHPACNSSGTIVAWARENADENYAGKHEIWVMDTDSDGTDAIKIVETHDDATQPVWAPGDGQIAFAWATSDSDSSDDYEIWKKNSDGSGNAEQLTDNAYEDKAPTWGAAILP